MMKRTYQLKKRAESQNRTRQKIIEAAIELHQTQGLTGTSMRDIAKRANVGAVTVYRHFPDEEALAGACSGTYFERHPFPDPDSWREIKDPRTRLRRALRDTYAYHRLTEPMIARIIGEVREQPIMAPYHAHWRRAADVLLAAWPPARRRDAKLKAAFALALSFDAWRLLVREQSLSDEQVIELMLLLTCSCPITNRN